MCHTQEENLSHVNEEWKVSHSSETPHLIKTAPLSLFPHDKAVFCSFVVILKALPKETPTKYLSLQKQRFPDAYK